MGLNDNNRHIECVTTSFGDIFESHNSELQHDFFKRKPTYLQLFQLKISFIPYPTEFYNDPPLCNVYHPPENS